MSFVIYLAFSSWIEDRISEMFVLIDVAICQVVGACQLAGQHQQTCWVISRRHATYIHTCRAQWLRGRAPDSRLREPGFESCAAVLKPWASFFTLHCSNSLSCKNEYLAIDSGGYVYTQPSAH